MAMGACVQGCLWQSLRLYVYVYVYVYVFVFVFVCGTAWSHTGQCQACLIHPLVRPSQSGS